MRDPAQFITQKGTPIIMIVSRLAFLLYFIFLLVIIAQQRLPSVAVFWVLYLFAIYAAAERAYHLLRGRQIDLTFAFPLLFAVYVLHLISLLMQGQEKLPLLNRAEHFTSFILIAYIVWVFFLKYLPQDVWQRHPYYTAILVLSVTSLAGVGNEMFELFFDAVFHAGVIGTHYDTSLDLLMNTLGAGLFLAVQLILMEGERGQTRQYPKRYS